eukprot:scaffold120867_cov57-Phaeocystis_antarctica.AAC.3
MPDKGDLRAHVARKGFCCTPNPALSLGTESRRCAAGWHMMRSKPTVEASAHSASFVPREGCIAGCCGGGPPRRGGSRRGGAAFQ